MASTKPLTKRMPIHWSSIKKSKPPIILLFSILAIWYRYHKAWCLWKIYILVYFIYLFYLILFIYLLIFSFLWFFLFFIFIYLFFILFFLFLFIIIIIFFFFLGGGFHMSQNGGWGETYDRKNEINRSIFYRFWWIKYFSWNSIPHKMKLNKTLLNKTKFCVGHTRYLGRFGQKRRQIDTNQGSIISDFCNQSVHKCTNLHTSHRNELIWTYQKILHEHCFLQNQNSLLLLINTILQNCFKYNTIRTLCSYAVIRILSILHIYITLVH